MSAKHTPGPWIIDIEDDKRWDIYVDVGDDLWVVVSITPLLGGDVLTDKDKANARLIAAAPDLLAFAREWLERQGADENYMTAKARAAIAKAIG